MFSEVDSDLKVVQGMAEQVKDVKVAIPKSCPALYIDNPNVLHRATFVVPLNPRRASFTARKGNWRRL